MLTGVIVKMPDSDENLYVCYEEKEKSWFVLERVKFNDGRGCSRFNIYYGPIPTTATSSLRAPSELPESFQRAFSS
jgi:hypothetical protein